MIIEEEGKEVVKKYKGKGGYSTEGLEQWETYYQNHVYELQGEEDNKD